MGEILLKNGGDPNIKEKNDVCTAGHCASEKGDVQALKILIIYGFNIHELTYSNQSLLHRTCIGINKKRMNVGMYLIYC